MPSKIEHPASFFVSARESLFGGLLNQSQVDGINGLLDALCKIGGDDARFWAADLATAFLETDRTMRPVKEYAGHEGDHYYWRMYDIEGDRPEVARQLGNLQPGDGAKYCGRGHVQCTGRKNYEDWQNRTGLPLVDQPDLILTAPGVSERILIEGCRLGTFTGRKLGDYLHTGLTDFRNARRVVNGTDKADEYASMCQRWLSAIQLGGLACTA